MTDDAYDFLVVRFVLRVDAALNFVELHGHGVPSSHRNATRERLDRRRAARKFRKSDVMPDETDFGQDQLEAESEGPAFFNQLRENDVTPFTQLNGNYAKTASLETIETRALRALHIGDEGHPEVMFSHGDGAPVATRTQANGKPVDPRVIWWAGRWHLRNNFGENLAAATFRSCFFDSLFRFSGMTPKRRDFCATFGHVRRSLGHIEGLLHAVVFELISEYCEQKIVGFSRS